MNSSPRYSPLFGRVGDRDFWAHECALLPRTCGKDLTKNFGWNDALKLTRGYLQIWVKLLKPLCFVFD